MSEGHDPAQSDLDEARRLLRLFGQAEHETESSRRSGPSPRRSGFGRAGGPPDWRNARAIVHPVASTPAAVPAAAIAPHEPAATGEQPRPKPAVPPWRDDEREQLSDAFDPHPGYRWI